MYICVLLPVIYIYMLWSIIITIIHSLLFLLIPQNNHCLIANSLPGLIYKTTKLIVSYVKCSTENS